MTAAVRSPRPSIPNPLAADGRPAPASDPSSASSLLVAIVYPLVYRRSQSAPRSSLAGHRRPDHLRDVRDPGARPEHRRWASPGCSTSATSRSTPSAPTRRRSSRRPTSASTSAGGSWSGSRSPSRPLFGILLGAPTLKLRGDYLAIVTLGFGEIVRIVFRNLGDFTLALPAFLGGAILIGPNANLTGGNVGINPIDPPTIPIPGPWGNQIVFSNQNPIASFYLVLGLLALTFFGLRPAARLEARPGLDGHPRGRDRGRRDGHQHGHDQAAGLLAGRQLLGLRRRLHRRLPDGDLRGELQLRRLDPRRRDHHPRRHRLAARRRHRRLRRPVRQPDAAGATSATRSSTTRSTRSASDRASTCCRDFNLVNYNYLIFGIVLAIMMISRPEGLFPVETRQGRAARHRRGRRGRRPARPTSWPSPRRSHEVELEESPRPTPRRAEPTSRPTMTAAAEGPR